MADNKNSEGHKRVSLLSAYETVRRRKDESNVGPCGPPGVPNQLPAFSGILHCSSERRGSNPHGSVWKTGALPIGHTRMVQDHFVEERHCSLPEIFSAAPSGLAGVFNEVILGRGDWNRTSGLEVPNFALCQTKLHPEVLKPLLRAAS